MRDNYLIVHFVLDKMLQNNSKRTKLKWLKMNDIFRFLKKKNVYRNEKVKSVDFASCEIRSVRKPNIYFIISMHKYDKKSNWQ